MNIAAGDAGGELDPHGATGNGTPIYIYISPQSSHSILFLGNPVGGLVFSNAFNNGQLQQLHEWTVRTSYLSALVAVKLYPP